MMTITTGERLLTEQEYLQLEEKSQVRHEFINGKLYEMPGGTLSHEQVIANIQFQLKLAGLKALAQGARVRVPQNQNYHYPDVVVTDEKLNNSLYSEQPLLLAEVLSPSTRANDLTDKFLAYRRFSTLEYYLLAEADFCQVTLFYKTESGDWESELFRQLTDIIQLPKLTAQLPLSGIYDSVDWSENL